MIVDDFLSRLERVKPSTRGNWTARCPAHDDKNPSMAIREADDGRVLVHCFAGCSVEQIVGAVGLELDALFPEKPITQAHATPSRLHFNARDVLKAIAEEVDICSIVLSDITNGNPVSDDDLRRFLEAVERIRDARQLANAG